MFNERDLRELIAFSAPEHVLSVYLNTVPAQGNADAYRLRLRTLLKEVDLPEDVAAVERYFEHTYDWSGRSVAVFSCAANNFFRTYPLAVPVPDQVYVSDHPAVNPLAEMFDVYGGYGVVLVDKQGARLFFFHIGELREQDGMVGETVKHSKLGGASSMPGRRGGVSGQTHVEDEVIDRNMKESVDFTVRFFEENRVRRVLLGGTDENVAMFRSLLPKTWQSLVVGSFPMGMTTSHTEVLAKAMQVGLDAERHREERMVDNAITAAARGGAGTTGLEDTLKAAHECRVQTLLVFEGYHEPGCRCQSCGFLANKKATVCPVCGGIMAAVPDVVEAAVRSVMQNSGGVEMVHYSTALHAAGKIGAILRY
jgi:peptide chain release factor subunit 1